MVITSCLLVSILIGSNAMAASYTFSFITGGSQYGGKAPKSGSEVVGVIARTGNISSSRYINVYGGRSNGSALSYTGTLAAYGPMMYLPYTDSSYRGDVYLWGSPSVIGASSTGDFYP